MEMEDIDTISRYYKIVFGYVFSLCGNRELTEDIVQDTFVKAILHEKCFRGDCKMESWLCQIAKNIYYSYLRKKKGQEPAERECAEHDFVHKLEEKDTAKAVLKVLHCLEIESCSVLSVALAAFCASFLISLTNSVCVFVLFTFDGI